jgi:hypothetical protein
MLIKIKEFLVNYFVGKTLELLQVENYVPIRDVQDRVRQLGQEYKEKKGVIEACTLYKENIEEVEYLFQAIAEYNASFIPHSSTTISETTSPATSTSVAVTKLAPS